MEVISVRWSWLSEYDRKYPPKPEVRTASLPGHRPLPPCMSSARELFTVGRTFKLLLHGRRTGTWILTGTWIVTRHSPKSCSFRFKDYLQDRRHLPWATMEEHILQDRVRWMNSVETAKRRSSK